MTRQVYETNALNQTKLPPKRVDDRIDDFTIEIEQPNGESGPRVFYVQGRALEKFAQVRGRETRAGAVL